MGPAEGCGGAAGTSSFVFMGDEGDVSPLALLVRDVVRAMMLCLDKYCVRVTIIQYAAIVCTLCWKVLCSLCLSVVLCAEFATVQLSGMGAGADSCGRACDRQYLTVDTSCCPLNTRASCVFQNICKLIHIHKYRSQ